MLNPCTQAWALKNSFGKHTSKNMAAKVIIEFLALKLTLNNLYSTANTIFIQALSPFDANYFIDHFEKKLI